MRLVIGFLLALLITPVFGQGFSIPRHTQIPPHVQQCIAGMALYQGFFMYRLAGITHEEAIQSLEMSMKVLKYQYEQSGRPALRPVDEVHADARAKLDEVYELEPFSLAIVNAMTSNKMQECIDAAEEAMPKPEEQQRMIPRNATGA